MKRRTKGGSSVKLAELLEIRSGVTAVIGGGGKTTLLRTLGEELAAAGGSVLLCTTTKILPFPGIPWAESLERLDELRRDHCLVCAGTYLPDSGKLTALDVPMAALAARFDYVLVEADGSAHRPLKAHAPHEPVIPAETNQTICVVGASGFGKPIEEAAHRPERYAELAGVPVTAPATPETEAAVLRTENLHDRIFINQVDSPQAAENARRLARFLDCPVVAGSLRQGRYFTC